MMFTVEKETGIKIENIFHIRETKSSGKDKNKQKTNNKNMKGKGSRLEAFQESFQDSQTYVGFGSSLSSLKQKQTLCVTLLRHAHQRPNQAQLSSPILFDIIWLL